MAPPKRTQRDVGGSRRSNIEVDYDDGKFISKVAQEEYEKLRGRYIAKEREFKPSYSDGQVWRMLNERGWLGFCGKPVEVPMGIVREFYANGKIEANGYAFVRGTIVDYQPEAIRSLFEIPHPPDGVEDWCLRSHENLDLDAIVERLCVPGTYWKRKVGTNEPMTFLARHMNRYARSWNLFICSNLMPSSHHHEITVERAILLWGILTEEYLDLGYLLYSSMVRYMRSGSTAMILHAAVVARLWSNAGIVWGVEEQIQQPMGPITHHNMAQMEEWPGGRAHERGLGYIIQDPEAEHAEEEQRERQVPSPRQQRVARGTRVDRAGPSRVRTVMSSSQHRRWRRQVDTVNDRTARFATDLINVFDGICSDMGFDADDV